MLPGSMSVDEGPDEGAPVGGERAGRKAGSEPGRADSERRSRQCRPREHPLAVSVRDTRGAPPPHPRPPAPPGEPARRLGEQKGARGGFESALLGEGDGVGTTASPGLPDAGLWAREASLRAGPPHLAAAAGVGGRAFAAGMPHWQGPLVPGCGEAVLRCLLAARSPLGSTVFLHQPPSLLLRLHHLSPLSVVSLNLALQFCHPCVLSVARAFLSSSPSGLSCICLDL